MRSFVALAVVALLAFVSAIPITPSAPRLQKRAEQFRLQGLKEFEIAERLSATLSESISFRTSLNHKFTSLFHSHASEDQVVDEQDERDLFLGDLAPGSLEAPSMLPKASASQRNAVLHSLCLMFRGEECDAGLFGYEGRESELRRPTGMRHWTHSFGGFRR